MSLALPYDRDHPVNLPRFASIATLDSTVEQQSTDNAPSDVLLHAGGSVWALAWCPVTKEAEINMETRTNRKKVSDISTAMYLAVGCHPHGDLLHKMGQPLHGTNCIQIWEFPNLDTPSNEREASLPRMVLGIGHDGRVIWNLSWCPDPSLMDAVESSEATCRTNLLPRLGLLAAVVGDGTVQVWAVPRPSLLMSRNFTSSAGDGDVSTLPYLAKPQPVARVAKEILNGSIPSSVDWLPSSPHDLLLIGCWDGSVAIVQLLPQMDSMDEDNDSSAPSSESFGFRILSYFLADSLAMRAARWLPPYVDAKTIDHISRYVFLTAGHEGTARIWDSRDQFVPLISVPIGASFLYDAIWTSSSISAVFASEDGSLRSLIIDGHQIKKSGSFRSTSTLISRGSNKGPLWSLSCHPSGCGFAYAGEDGVVGCADASISLLSRRRDAHSPVGAFRWNDNILHILEKKDLINNTGRYKGALETNNNDAGLAELNAVPQIIQRVAWSPASAKNGIHSRAWLAYGGSSGIVRCHWMSLADALQ